MKLRLVSFGRERPGEVTAPLVEEYRARIARTVELDLIELRAETGPQAREREAEALFALLAKVKGPSELWALDERGGQLTSPQFAERIGRARDRATSLTLCIGGDEGLSQLVRDRAQLVLGLSKLTLPHKLARAVVLEQLYRAFEILRGSPYHK